MIPIIITLVTKAGGSEELLEDVNEEMQTVGMQLNVNITINVVDRFGKRKVLDRETSFLYF